MGIFSFLQKNTYKNICRVMLNSYKIAKSQNPNYTERELCAFALSCRPTWNKSSDNDFLFTRKHGEKLEIKGRDTIKDVLRNLIVIETIPSFASSQNQDYIFETLQNIIKVINEEYKKVFI